MKKFIKGKKPEPKKEAPKSEKPSQKGMRAKMYGDKE